MLQSGIGLIAAFFALKSVLEKCYKMSSNQTGKTTLKDVLPNQYIVIFHAAIAR